MMELYDRPVEIYIYSTCALLSRCRCWHTERDAAAAAVPIVFGSVSAGKAPIRLSYHSRSHFNAVVAATRESVLRSPPGVRAAADDLWLSIAEHAGIRGYAHSDVACACARRRSRGCGVKLGGLISDGPRVGARASGAGTVAQGVRGAARRQGRINRRRRRHEECAAELTQGV
jgi:hypothetical protein